MVEYISSQQLEALIKSKSNDFLIVDVRDEPRGGNIKGRINIPSKEFPLKLDQLIDDTQNVSKIIFHCINSRQRGPKAAQMYAKARSSREGGTDANYQVLVLEGGLAVFQRSFRHDPELVENWDEKVWS